MWAPNALWEAVRSRRSSAYSYAVGSYLYRIYSYSRIDLYLIVIMQLSIGLYMSTLVCNLTENLLYRIIHIKG